MTATPDTRMTQGDARIWARRLRKVGFSPVTVHYAPDGAATGELLGGGYYLDCNWPYESDNLPPDLHAAFAYQDYGNVEGIYEDWTLLQRVVNRDAARRTLARFRVVRLGMGSRPLPTIDRTPWEPQFIPAGRIVADADDWPFGIQRHPEVHPGPAARPASRCDGAGMTGRADASTRRRRYPGGIGWLTTLAPHQRNYRSTSAALY